MQYQKVIEQLGYSPKEAKVYLTSLRLGEAHISDIANKVGIPRSSAQAIVDRLHQDGLMNFYIMRRYKYWVAENPERLLVNMKKREAAIEEALPDMLKMRKIARKNTNNKQPNNGLRMMQICADSSAQPMLIADENAEIKYVNSAWEKLFSYTANEVIGKNTNILASPETPKEVYVAMWRSLLRKELFHTDRVTDKRKDGTLLNMETTIFCIEHGQNLFYVQILKKKST